MKQDLRSASYQWRNTRRFLKPPFRVSFSETKTGHWHGGSPQHQKARCFTCKKPLRLVWTIDLSDALLPDALREAFPKLTKLPLYYCFNCPEATTYQVKSETTLSCMHPAGHEGALLHRLAEEWRPEFDQRCQLLAVSAVVCADETSWSLNSVWALLSEQARLLIFGCHKDAATLATLLPKETFAGVLVSDDASVYRGFNQAQKCWAHLLRKAIKPAKNRRTDQTTRSVSGARRRTILTSVLESLRTRLPVFDGQSVLAEVSQWFQTGVSCFGRLLKTLGLPPLATSPLDVLVPLPPSD